MVDSLAEGVIITNLDGTILKVNPAVVHMHRYEHATELIGRSSFDLIAETDRQLAELNMKRTLESGNSGTIRYRFITKDMTEFPGELNATLLRDHAGKPIGFIAIIRDVTERKKMEEALHIERDKLRNILNTMRDCIYIIKEQYEIDYANPALEHQFGLAENRKSYNYFHGRSEVCPWCRNREVFAGRTVVREWHPGELRGNNEKVYESVNIPLRNADCTTSKLGILRDITERKLYEDHLLEYQEKLRMLASNLILAEYLVAPDYSFYKLPDSVSDEIGALTEPLAVGVHAARRSKLQLGDTVAIVGAGTIGLSTLLATRAAGASKIYTLEISKVRGERALAMGATAIINPEEGDPVEQIRDLTGGLGVVVSFDCVGLPISGPLAVELARKAGTIVILGMSWQPSPDFSFINIMLTEKTVLGSIGYQRDTPTVIELLASGRIEPSGLITGKIALKDAVEKGFKELINNPEKHLKILLRP